jgi:hypothetical protein
MKIPLWSQGILSSKRTWGHFARSFLLSSMTSDRLSHFLSNRPAQSFSALLNDFRLFTHHRNLVYVSIEKQTMDNICWYVPGETKMLAHTLHGLVELWRSFVGSFNLLWHPYYPNLQCQPKVGPLSGQWFRVFWTTQSLVTRKICSDDYHKDYLFPPTKTAVTSVG